MNCAPNGPVLLDIENQKAPPTYQINSLLQSSNALLNQGEKLAGNNDSVRIDNESSFFGPPPSAASYAREGKNETTAARVHRGITTAQVDGIRQTEASVISDSESVEDRNDFK